MADLDFDTVLEIRVNPKKNAPKVSKAPKFEF